MTSDRSTVLRSYTLEAELRGARGAYARAGRLHGISDETVRRWVHEAEQETDDLTYVSPPGGYPVPIPAESAANMPQDIPHERKITTGTPHELPDDATEATDEPEPHVQPDATLQPEVATFERRVATQRLDPGWEQWWITCAHDHMPTVQLVLGLVIVWLLWSVR